MNTVLLKIFFTLCVLQHFLSAQEITKAGTTMGAFLKIGIGGRASGMGEAFIATANDVTALYWNPAGISWLSGSRAYFSQTNWLGELSHSFSAVSLDFKDKGTVAGYLILLRAPDQEVTTVESPNGTGQMYSYQDLAIGVTYSRKISEDFSVGVSAKYIASTLYRLGAQAIAFDVGTMYLIPNTSLRLAMNLQNFGGKMQYTGDNLERPIDIDPTTTGETDRVTAFLKTEQWDIPLSFKVGVANDFHLTDDVRLTVAVDAINPNDNRENINVGGEIGFQEYIFLRGGFKSINVDQSEGGLSLGGGITIPISEFHVNADYGYTDWGRFKSIHRFGIGIQF